jgi:soluble lytic murein transglycosylase
LRTRRFVLSAICAGALASPSGGVRAADDTSRSFWLQPAPRDAAEAALREAATAAGGVQARVEALLRVSSTYPGTAISGLAQLTAGMALQESGRARDALAFFRHPDVAKTALSDYALLALARAQEAAGDVTQAGDTYVAAADAVPGSPLVCTALFAGALALRTSGRADKALATVGRAAKECGTQQPRALLVMGLAQEAGNDIAAAGATYRRVVDEFPTSPQAREAADHLTRLKARLPPVPVDAQAARDLKRGLALFDAAQYADAARLLKAALPHAGAANADVVRVRLGRALLALDKQKEALPLLGAIKPGSFYEAEAAFHLAKMDAARRKNAAALESVATRFPKTPWAEEALFALANFHQKDARDDESLPAYRQLVEQFPDGRYYDRSLWRVAWGEYRARRFAEAAQMLERAAHGRTPSTFTPGFLYWAGRARIAMGDAAGGRRLLAETVVRYKHAYHGLRAQEVLAGLPATGTPPPGLAPMPAEAGAELPEPRFSRMRSLLLVDRIEEALQELRILPVSPKVQATIAWIEWRRGQLRPAIIDMKRAYPQYVTAAGDQLPETVWRILYPLEYGDALRASSAQAGLDPALVAGLVCQESTFDTEAKSRVGALGLMQIMPTTGAELSGQPRRRFQTGTLHDPTVGLMLGTRYLKDLIRRFDGRVEMALAAYNAGPQRVRNWQASRPGMSPEEFVESIPFQETRTYVMTILTSREHYRKLYDLPGAPGVMPVTAGAP